MVEAGRIGFKLIEEELAQAMVVFDGLSADADGKTRPSERTDAAERQ